MIRILPTRTLNKNVLARRACLWRERVAFGYYHPIARFHYATTTMSHSGHSASESPESPAALAKRKNIQSLRDAISHKQPAAFGTLSIPADQWTIFYGKKGNTKYATCTPLGFIIC